MSEDGSYILSLLAAAAPAVLLVVAMGIAASTIGTPWFRAVLAGAPIPLGALVGMRLRGVDAKAVVDAYIRIFKCGPTIDVARLEALAIAGGDPRRVAAAWTRARMAGVDLDFRRAAEIELAGQDLAAVVDEAVRAAGPPTLDDGERGG